MQMNPGFLSWLLMLITVILFGSGWKDVMMRGITSRGILLFFVSWLIGSFLSIAIPGGSVALWIIVLMVVIWNVLWKLDGIVYKLHVVSVGIFMGSVSFFMQETSQWIPSAIYGNLELCMAVLIGAFIIAAIKSPAAQIAALSIGLLLGECFILIIHRNHVGFELGSWNLQDRWWLNVFMTRGLAIGLMYTLLAGKHGMISAATAIKTGMKKRMGSGD